MWEGERDPLGACRKSEEVQTHFTSVKNSQRTEESQSSREANLIELLPSPYVKIWTVVLWRMGYDLYCETLFLSFLRCRHQDRKTLCPGKSLTNFLKSVIWKQL